MGQVISLADRIAAGRRAIAKAKVEGKDTREWEAHLAKLMARGITASDVARAFPGGVRMIIKPGPACRVCGFTIPLSRDRDGRWYQNLWLHKCGSHTVLTDPDVWPF